MTLNDEMILGTLLSDVDIFKIQHNEVKHSLHKEQVEKENMKKHVSKLAELEKKEAELSAMEKKLKNNKGRAAVAHTNFASRDNECVVPPSTKAHTKKLKTEMHKAERAEMISHIKTLKR